MCYEEINFNEVIKEIVILTVAVAIIAAAVIFPCTESYVRQQYFRSGYCLGEFCAAALVSDYYDLNVVLLIIGFLTCGREFGVKTVYTSIMLPVFIGIF